MEDLIEFAAQNIQEYSHAAAGFGIGAATTYFGKMNAQRKGREFFPDGPEEEWYEHILEEDPMYDEEDLSDGRLMQLYYDNFDTVSKNAKQGFHSFVSTAIVDVFETFSLDSSFVDFQDYPEMAAGFYAGIKAAEHAPTPIDAAEAYRDVVGTGDRSSEN
ncbi:MAG: hypothetical protein ABEK10_02695 [Candidatus Nanosalina sp.]